MKWDYIILTFYSITLLYVHRLELYVKTVQTILEWSTWLPVSQSSPSIPPTLAHIIPPQTASALAKRPWPWHWKYLEHFPRTCMSRLLVKREPRTKGVIQLVFRTLLGRPSYPCIWPHPLIPRRSWIPTSFSPANRPCQQLPEIAARICLCEKMILCSGPLKSVPRLFLILSTSWLRLFTALKCPKAKPIHPS